MFLAFDGIVASPRSGRSQGVSNELGTGDTTAAIVHLDQPPVHDTLALRSWLTLARLVAPHATRLDRDSSAVVRVALRAWLDSVPLTKAEQRTLRRALDAAVIRGDSLVRRHIGYAYSEQFRTYGIPAGISSPAGGTRELRLTSAQLRVLGPDLARVVKAGGASAIVFAQAQLDVPTPSPQDYADDAFSASFVQRLADGINARQTTRQSILFVLDSGWPDSLSRSETYDTLNEFTTATLALFGVSAYLPPDSPDEAWSPPPNTHVLGIAQALAPLREAMPNDSLSVVYLPLTAVQGARPLLRRLLLTERMLQLQAWRGWRADDGTCSDRSSFDLRLECLSTIASMPEIPDSIAAAVDQELGQLVPDGTAEAYATSQRTTLDLLDAVWHLLQAWSFRNGGTAAYLNLSWTTPSVTESFPSTPDIQPSDVTIVAATGNAGVTVQGGSTTEFADRAVVNDPHFVLVENLGTDLAPMCGSTLIDTSDVIRGAVVGFSGLVTASGICGTSFAAPRVSWLLATGETMRPSSCARGFKARRARLNAAAKQAIDDGEPLAWPLTYLGLASGSESLVGQDCAP